jgi:hypothetical protein
LQQQLIAGTCAPNAQHVAQALQQLQ